jgi:hypothetical protein
MPNYRLTFKITGTTLPAMAGYYGADGQSSTIWKRAGGGAYAWQSPTFANTFFLGEAVDLNAFHTVTVSGATDAAFDGAYVYSSTLAKWIKGVEPATVYSIWKDGTTWKMTDGTTTYTAPDNGLNVPPATFERTV